MRLFSSHLLIVHSSSFTSSLFVLVGVLFTFSSYVLIAFVCVQFGVIVRIWLKGGDVVKSTTRWPLAFLSNV